MNDLQKKFVEYLAEFQYISIESCLAQHKCDSEAVNVLSNMSELQIQQYLAMMKALKNVQITDLIKK